jgi:alpha-mannosidase
VVGDALCRLRAAADEAHAGWLPERIGPYPVKRIEGVYGGVGSIDGGLPLEPGRSLTISCDLHSPTGEPLELMLWSLFPTTLRLDGRLLSDDEVPIAACGPALIPLAPTGVLEMTVHAPDHQLFNEWHWFRFTTESGRRRFNRLDTAWAQLYLASELAPDDKAVELAALAALEDDLAGMVEALLPVADAAAGLTVHFVGHSHIDMNWLWRRPDTEAVVLRDMASVLALMDDYPEMRLTHSQPATYEIVRQRAPELFERILGHIAEGRWEPATLQWVEGDTNMAGSEATARQLLEAVRYSRQVLGAQPTVLLAPDTFGHTGNLPQLVASAGGRAYYHHRANPGHAHQTIWPAYWWEGQDGTRVLAVSTPTYSGEITAGDTARLAVLFARDKGLSDAMFFYGVGDHGGGPTRESLETLKFLQTQTLLPQMKCSTVADFAEAVASATLPVHRGESATTFEGCYTTHVDTKVLNRQGEALLETAETLAALAGLNADLDQAWKTVLFNQFHDILDGSAIAEVYADQAVEFEAEVRAAAQPVIDQAVAALAGDGIAVVNPLGWDRTDVVCVAGVTGSGAVLVRANNGESVIGQHTDDGLVFVATVPAFGTAVYQVGDAADVDADSMPVDEDERYLNVGGNRIRKEAGVLTTLKDFRPELAHNVLTVQDEHPHEMSAWDIRDVHTEHSLLRGAETTVVERGPVRTVVEVRHRVRRSTITERVAFYAALPRIDFDAEIDWQEPGGEEAGVPSLKVSFAAPLARPEAWFETPFGAVERPADGQESPALRWAAVQGGQAGGRGFAVLNDSRHGYDALGSRLRLTLVRTAYSPDPASDMGRHRTRFALLPYEGDWRDGDAAVVRQAAGFNRPLIATTAGTPAEAAARWRPVVEGTAVVSGLKRRRTEHGTEWVLRLYDATGRGATARFDPPPHARVYEATITEDRVRPVDPTTTLTLRPWQVLTLVIEER